MKYLLLLFALTACNDVVVTPADIKELKAADEQVRDDLRKTQLEILDREEEKCYRSKKLIVLCLRRVDDMRKEFGIEIR